MLGAATVTTRPACQKTLATSLKASSVCTCYWVTATWDTNSIIAMSYKQPSLHTVPDLHTIKWRNLRLAHSKREKI